MVNRNSTKWVGGKKKKRKTERKGFILECNKTLDFFPPSFEDYKNVIFKLDCKHQYT